jgi:hypothetical protein
VSQTVKKRAALWGPLLVLLLGVVVWAGTPVSENYGRLKRDSGGAIAAHRAHSSTDSSLTDASPEDIQPTNGDMTLVVAPRFTTAGATVTVACFLYDDNGGGSYTLMGVADVQTATASSEIRESAAGDYMVLEPLYFDLAGADCFDIRYFDESGGTVEGWAWTVGPASRAAE